MHNMLPKIVPIIDAKRYAELEAKYNCYFDDNKRLVFTYNNEQKFTFYNFKSIDNLPKLNTIMCLFHNLLLLCDKKENNKKSIITTTQAIFFAAIEYPTMGDKFRFIKDTDLDLLDFVEMCSIAWYDGFNFMRKQIDQSILSSIETDGNKKINNSEPLQEYRRTLDSVEESKNILLSISECINVIPC